MIDPSQIFALNTMGERIAPIPPREAARLAGNASKLEGALESGAVSSGLEGALGAGLGAAVGSIFGFAGNGAIIGAATGGAGGLLHGLSRGQQAADRQANEQIRALALHRDKLFRDYTKSGYVFFPKADYHEIEMLLVNEETGDTEEIKTPLR